MNKKQNIGISFILPLFSKSDKVVDLFEMISSQTIDNIELICVIERDCSEDIEQLIIEYSNRINIKKVYVDKSKSIMYKMNTGILSATREYTALLCEYFIPNTTCYEKLYENAKKLDADVAMIGGFSYHDDSENSDAVLEDPFRLEYSIGKMCRKGCMKYYYDKIFRTKILKDNGITFIESPYYSEYLFLLDVLYKANKLVVVNGIDYKVFDTCLNDNESDNDELSGNCAYNIFTKILERLSIYDLSIETKSCVIEYNINEYANIVLCMPCYTKELLDKIDNLINKNNS